MVAGPHYQTGRFEGGFYFCFCAVGCVAAAGLLFVSCRVREKYKVGQQRCFVCLEMWRANTMCADRPCGPKNRRQKYHHLGQNPRPPATGVGHMRRDG